MGKVAVPKGRWMTVSPRRDGTGVPVGWVDVPKSGRKPSSPRDNLNSMGTACFPCAREHTPLLVFRCPLPSIFMKFTWHANPHYRYL